MRPAAWRQVPPGPGLGCDPDEAVLERYRRAPVGEAREGHP